MSDEQKLLQTISHLETQIRMLESDLIHDSLTGLRTRTFLEEELNIYLSAIYAAADSGRREWFGFKNLSMLFFDIDNFKQKNDMYGHEAGDRILRIIAQTITKNTREGDTVARWGGEEIVAVILGANEADAKQKAESIRQKVEALAFESFPDLKVTVSVGVAHASLKMTCEHLVKNADKAMYRAKETGKNKVVAYSELGE